jgi:hypothetical protein
LGAIIVPERLGESIRSDALRLASGASLKPIAFFCLPFSLIDIRRVKSMLQKLIPASLLGSFLFIGVGVAANPAFNFVTINYPEGVVTEAQGINVEGDIAGLYTDTSGVVHGLLLHRGVFTSIDYPGAAFTYVTGINPAGDIVGNYIMAGEDPVVVFSWAVAALNAGQRSRLCTEAEWDVDLARLSRASELNCTAYPARRLRPRMLS